VSLFLKLLYADPPTVQKLSIHYLAVVICT